MKPIITGSGERVGPCGSNPRHQVADYLWLWYRIGAPLEVERVFLEHPEITAALATGVEDSAKGEALHLMVVLAAGAQATPDGILHWGRKRLDRQKLPDAIHIATDLPQGRTGKADRRALRETLSR